MREMETLYDPGCKIGLGFTNTATREGVVTDGVASERPNCRRRFVVRAEAHEKMRLPGEELVFLRDDNA